MEELTGPEKIVLAAYYWRADGYPVSDNPRDEYTLEALISAIENHFGSKGN